MKPNRWALLACLVAWSATASAAVVISKSTSNVQYIPGLASFQTSGGQMNDLQVTASFSNGLSETLSWSAFTATSGGVSGTGWALYGNGDTYFSPWQFSMNQSLGRLLGFVLDASTSGQYTVFDTVAPSSGGTPGSSNGLDFAFTSGCSACNAQVAYSNAVALSGRRPAGDLFHTVSVSFLDDTGPTGNFRFLQDTDNDVRLVINPVPEPGSLALVGAAVVGWLALRRRRPA